jgi:hypothetical protein
LPAGLSLSGDTISGLPNVCGQTVITLTATNVAGSDTETLLLTIAPASGMVPPAPTIDSPPAVPQPVIAGQAVTLTAAANDPGVGLLTYTWNFDDGSTATGSTVSHVFAAPGMYTATVIISNGVTSTTATVPVIINAILTSNPIPFTITKQSFAFDFSKAKNDSLRLTGVLPISTAFAPAGKSLTVIIGDYTSKLTLNPKGHAKNNADSVKLLGSMKNGVFTGFALGFSYTVKKQNLFSSLQACGFSNADVSSQPISVPVLVYLDGIGYLANANVKYTATSGKSGVAK